MAAMRRWFALTRRRGCVEFAGAKLGLLHLWPDGRVDRLQPSRVSLGYQQPPSETPALQRIDYASGSTFVIVSDGFTDQIGGDGNGRRAYGYRRLVQLLEASRGETAETIARRMRDSLQQWQGSELRRDDVTAVVF